MLSVCTYNCNGLASVKQYAASNTIAGVLQQLGAGMLNGAAACSCCIRMYPTAVQPHSQEPISCVVRRYRMLPRDEAVPSRPVASSFPAHS